MILSSGSVRRFTSSRMRSGEPMLRLLIHDVVPFRPDLSPLCVRLATCTLSRSFVTRFHGAWVPACLGFIGMYHFIDCGAISTRTRQVVIQTQKCQTKNPMREW